MVLRTTAAAMAALIAVAAPARAELPEGCRGGIDAAAIYRACDEFVAGGARGKDLVAALLNKGYAAGALGRAVDAYEVFTAATEAGPDDPQTWISRAQALYQLHRYDESMLDLVEAMKLAPDNSIPLNMMGKNHYSLGNLDKAIEFYTRAIDLNTNHFNAFYNRAVAYYQKNELAAASRDVTAALLMLPPDDRRRGEVRELQFAINQAAAAQQTAQPQPTQ